MSNFVPVLHGQPVEYLFTALKAYAEGKRRSGIMQPLAADLRDEDIQNLADYYAGLAPTEEEPSSRIPPRSRTGASWPSKARRRLAFRLAWPAMAIPVELRLALPGSTLPI